MSFYSASYNVHTIRILIIALFFLEQNLCHDDYLVGDVIHIHFLFFFLLVLQIDIFFLSIEFSFRWSGYLIWTMKRLEGIWWWYTYRWKDYLKLNCLNFLLCFFFLTNFEISRRFYGRFYIGRKTIDFMRLVP